MHKLLVGLAKPWRFHSFGAKTISQSKQIEILIIACVAFLIICMVIKLIGSSISPILGELAEVESISAATKAVNSAAAEFLTSSPVEYSTLVTLKYDGNGAVASLETDTLKLNSLCAEIGGHILDYIKKNDSVSTRIPLGSLAGSPILSGKGPRIRVRSALAGGITAKSESSFSSAGVNQSCHRIIVMISFSYKLVLPDGLRDVSVTIPVCVAETVIVGKVPSCFYSQKQ